jgi:hypothetical protein
MPAGKVVDPPHSLKLTEDCALDEVAVLVTSRYTIFADINKISSIFIMFCFFWNMFIL